MTCAVPVLPETSWPAIARARGRADAVDREPEPVAHGLEHLLRDLEQGPRRGHAEVSPPLPEVHGLDDVRRDERAAVGDGGNHARERNRRDRHLALADADRNRLARIPLLVRRAHLPLGRGHEALVLAGQVDAGLPHQPEQLGVPVDRVDLHQVRDRVEVDVARLLDRVPQIERAVPFLLVAVEDVAVELLRARAGDTIIGRDEAFGERRDGHEDLERGSGRVSSLDEPVLQRPGRVGRERGPLVGAQPIREVVRVEFGLAGHRQHVAVARVQEDRGARQTLRLVRGLERALQVVVDRQHQPRADLGFFLAALLDLTSARVHRDVLRAVLAHEVRVVGALEPGLADNRALCEPRVFHLLQLRFLHLADVAEEVGGKAALRVAPRRHLLHDDLRQLQLARHDRGHLLEARVLDDGDGPERRLETVAAHDVGEVRLLHAGRGGQPPDRIAQVARIRTLFPDDRDRVRVVVLDEHLPVAVEQHAARRAERNGAQLVALRHFQVLLVLRDLEDPEADGEERQTDNRHAPKDAQADQQPLAIFKGDGRQHDSVYRLPFPPLQPRSAALPARGEARQHLAELEGDQPAGGIE